MHLKKIMAALFTVVLLLTGDPTWAEPKIQIDVKTILASQDTDYIEPQLSDLAQELQSIFKYSSYRLLAEDKMNLAMNQTGSSALPGDRVLKIRPQKIEGDRVTLQLEIFKKGRSIFKTVIQLLNRGSITVGGPKYKKGYLLFNIACSY